ncbi:MAG: hypothetical protein ACRCWY_09090 [Cellulosilyticaceae bacterium]
MKKGTVLKSLILAGILAMNTVATFASSGAGATVQQSSIRYSELFSPGWMWVDVNLQGTDFNTKDVYKISDAVSTNYDIVPQSLGTGDGDRHFEFGHYTINPNMDYIGDLEITIDGSVLTTGKDVTAKVKVINDVGATPKVTTDVTKISKKQLEQGVDITFQLENARFDTSCTAYRPRVSIIKNSNVYNMSVLPYCNAIRPNEIKFHIKAVNGVPFYVNELEIVFDSSSTNVNVPTMVKIPLTK